MPTSSQAMIVMVGEGEDPRIPRRRYSTGAGQIVITSYDFDRAARCDDKMLGRVRFDADSSSGSCDEVIAKETYNFVGRRNRMEEKNPITNLPYGQYYDNALTGMEHLGFRRRRVGNSGQTTLVPIKSSSVKSNTHQMTLSRHGTCSTEDSSKYETYSTTDHVIDKALPSFREPKLSLLDEVKCTVNYDNRICPAMGMRSSLPPRNTFAVCVSFRENDNFTHKEVKDILEENFGFTIRSVQFDPMSVRTIKHTEIAGSRWIITYSNAEECNHVINQCLEYNGDKISVKSLDDVHLCEYEAYNILLEEIRRNSQLMNAKRHCKNTKLNSKRKK